MKLGYWLDDHNTRLIMYQCKLYASIPQSNRRTRMASIRHILERNQKSKLNNSAVELYVHVHWVCIFLVCVR